MCLFWSKIHTSIKKSYQTNAKPQEQVKQYYCQCLSILPPLTFSLFHSSRMLISFTKQEDAPDWWGYSLAFLMFFTAILQTLILHRHFQYCFVTGMNVRTALIGAIYRKVRIPLCSVFPRAYLNSVTSCFFGHHWSAGPSDNKCCQTLLYCW